MVPLYGQMSAIVCGGNMVILSGVVVLGGTGILVCKLGGNVVGNVVT